MMYKHATYPLGHADSNSRQLHLQSPRGSLYVALGGWPTWQDRMLALHSPSTRRTLVLFILHIGLPRKTSFEQRVP